MRSSLLTVIIIIFSIFSKAQVPVNSGVVFAKEFSKEIALYRAKAFVIETVLGISSEVVGFQIDPLAASSSGELTSLVYRCQEKGKEGMVLGFYGDYWNSAGVEYKGFSFKDISKDKALYLLDTIQKAIDDYSTFLSQDKDNNNIYFKAEGMTFLISNMTGGIKIRVFRNEFDAEWDMTAFRRTKRRLLNKLNE